MLEAHPDCPVHLSKYMIYHTTHTATVQELCGRAEWTLDRIVAHGFARLLAAQGSISTISGIAATFV